MRTKVFLLFSFVIFLFSCSNPFANQQLSMTTDPGVTEAWLSLHVDGVKSGADYILQRDGKTIFSGKLQSADTVVYDSLLQPATRYTYRFFARENGEASPGLQSTLTTLDTTIHNFSWQSYEFGGQKGSSSFYDVAIIDENDIWAVGEIYTADNKYNAAHWNGQKWELKMIGFTYQGYYTVPSISTIFAFDSNDIWFGGIHWDGTKYELKNKNFPLLPNGDGWKVNKIWGTSSSNFYVVGNSGMIAHYNGTSWTKIESGTDLPIQDIWGSVNPSTGETEILCVASDYWNSYDRKLLQLKNNTAREIIPSYTPGTVKALWFIAGEKYLLGGDWLFYRNEKKSNWRQDWIGINHAYILSVSGTGLNNILTCGGFGEIMHYNGKSWRNYYETTKVAGNYNAVKTYQNIAVAVGENLHSGNIDSKAIVLVGQH